MPMETISEENQIKFFQVNTLNLELGQKATVKAI